MKSISLSDVDWMLRIRMTEDGHWTIKDQPANEGLPGKWLLVCVNRE